MNLTLKEYIKKVENNELNPADTVNHYLKKAQKDNDELFSFIRFHQDYIKKNIEDFKTKKLKGAPIGIKDNFMTKGYETTCGSKILEGYIPPYTATSISNLEKNGGIMIGKTNMDEFAMGSSTETSYFGNTINNYGKNRIPGGSSGGSAVAVSNDDCLGALGTDTAGSIRQPAALTGIVGMKPTYGRVSRYGIQALASSLDQAGTFTKTVEDAVILLDAISGYDTKDSTSKEIADQKDSWYKALKENDLKGMNIAIPNEFFEKGLNEGIKSNILDTIQILKELGAKIDYIDMPILKYGLSIYYTLMPAEATTNLARFDGIRFGLQRNTFDFESVNEYYKNIRTEGFGEETKRRIMIGNFVLSAGYYDAYYLKARKAQEQMKIEFDKVFEKYDAIVGPTSPEVAWKIGQKTDDPIKMYLSDIYTISANIGGLPAMSIPSGLLEDNGENLPIGFQIMTNKWKEDKIFHIANLLEKKIGFRKLIKE